MYRFRSFPRVLALSVACLLSSVSSHGAVVYIDKNATGNTHNGASWATAFPSVTAGLASARSGDEAWVARGTYVERITLPSGVALYGGFNGTETSRGQRSAHANETILDGAMGGSVVTIPANATAGTVLEGFTIRFGAGVTYGGGVFCGESASPIVRNNTFTDNSAGAGGGFYAKSASPRLYGNAFSRNQAIYGGAVYLSEGLPAVEGNNFFANTAIVSSGASSEGGGLYLDSADIPIVNNTFVGNSASEGGAIDVVGCTPSIINNIFAYNLVAVTGDYDTVFKGNCFYANAVADTTRVDTDPIGTSGNFRGDPLLAGYLSGDLHIQPGSPCRNKGLNSAVTQSIDIDGQARIQNGTVDIGADESDGTTWTVAARIVRVSPTGSDLNDGSSWTAARRSIQGAIDLVTGRGGEVWVANGTYTEAVTVGTFARLYGGFAGTETARSQRQAGTGRTLIDGRAGGRIAIADASLQAVVDGFAVFGGPGLRSGANTTATISANTLRAGDYGIYSSGGALTITDNTIRDNTYGGISCGGSSLIVRNVIMGNTATQYGAGICVSTPATISDNLVAGNGAAICGGIYLSGYSQSGAVTLTNNTVVCNSGSGICIDGVTITAVNNIVAFNGTGIEEQPAESAIPAYRNNDVYGNMATDFVSSAYPTPRPSPIGTNGNISVDPVFAGRSTADFRLQPASPCRDKGDNTVVVAGDLDVNGQARSQGSRVDIGATESSGLTVTPVPAARFYVSQQGNDANSGATWASAKRSVSAALQEVGRGAAEIWVAGGTYAERPLLSAFTSLYGGFSGAETVQTQRLPASNITILDGSANGPVLTVRGGMAPEIVDGFTIRNGMWVSDGSQIEPGGINCRSASPTISGNIITANAGSIGGAIGCQESYPTIVGNTIIGNSADLGGAVYTMGCTSTIARNLIASNSGGGTYSNSSTDAVTCNEIALNTGACITFSYGKGTVSCNYIHNNTAAGAAIMCSQSPVNVTDNVLVANTGPVSYGRIPYNLDCDGPGSTGTFANNTFVGSAAQAMGGIWSEYQATPRIANNILAYLPVGIAVSTLSPASPSFVSNCLWSNSVGYQGVADQAGANGNIAADPIFFAPGRGNYRITEGSPCRDAGWNDAVGAGDVDRDGRQRVVNLRVDVGAYELDASTEYSLSDVRTALAVAAGLTKAVPAQISRLDIGAASLAGVVDLTDAISLARHVAGLDPAP